MATGLGAVAFEVAAIRACSALFGNSMHSVAVVTATFLGALALGALVVGRFADRVKRPLALFGWLATAGGVAAFAAPQLIAVSAAWASAAVLEESLWLAGLLLLPGAILVVGPVAFLLGGTLPAMVAGVDATADRRRDPGLLYAANTLGSVVGALLAGLVLLEALGTLLTLRLCGGLLLLAGVAGLLVTQGTGAADAARQSDSDLAAPAPGSSVASPTPRSAILLCTACAGFSALAFEVLSTRLLAQYLHNSAHSFALVLAVYLSGVAFGAVLGANQLARCPDFSRVAVTLAAALGLCAALAAPAVVALGESLTITLAGGAGRQLLLAACLLPATIASGALFALLLSRPYRADRPGRHAGVLTLFNTLGGIAGSLLAGFVLLPAMGLRNGLLLVALVAAAGALPLVRSRAALLTGLLGVVLPVLVLLPAELRPLPKHPRFNRLIAYREGPVANVAVLESPDEDRPVLFVNRTTLQGGGEAALRLETKQGLLPVALHGNPRSALVLGVGTGASIAGLLNGGVTAVSAVEVVDSVLELLPLFSGRTGNLMLRPGVEFFRRDAVAFVHAVSQEYDLILGDLFFPWLDGAGALYSLEHFRAVRQRLAPGGLFCQWLPLHQLRWEDFGLVARTFSKAFPQTWIFLCEPRASHPVVALVGAESGVRIDPAQVDRLFQDSRHAAAFQAAGLNDATDLLELYFGDQYTIDAAFGGARALGEERLLNTLDRPVVEYRSARTTESETQLLLQNFLNLAMDLGGSPVSYVELPADLDPEERSAVERQLNVRASALVQFLNGHYWKLRAELVQDDPIGDEEREATWYLAGVHIEPQHPALNVAATELAARMLRGRRLSEVVGFASQFWSRNPANVDLARSLGTAHLLLGEEQQAQAVLAKAVELEPQNPDNLMLLGMAHFLHGEDAEAEAALGAAAARSRVPLSGLAVAMQTALAGDPLLAQEQILPLVEHPVWGVLARRTLARCQQIEAGSALPEGDVGG